MATAAQPAPESRQRLPRLAAAVVLLREVQDEVHVLLVQRSTEARFMPGAWVFPGGSTQAGDADRAQQDGPSQEPPGTGETEALLRAAALRELHEEAAISLRGPHELWPFVRWITPPQVPVRFDTSFYLALAPAGQQPRADGEECIDWRFLAPESALAEHREGALSLAFPTVKQLEALCGFASAAALIETLGKGDMQPVEPRISASGDSISIVMPGEPGYA